MNLPQGWATATVEELAGPKGLVTDGDWVESKDQDAEGDVRLIQLADVGEGIFRDRSRRFMLSKVAAELRCTYLTPEDVLIARMPDPLGRACVFPGLDQPAVTAVDVMIWRTDGSLADANWFANAINSPIMRSRMVEEASGTTRQRVAGGRIKKFEVPFPSLAEQRRIVAKLDALFARLARARAELDRISGQASKLRSRAIRSAFHGELSANWRANHQFRISGDENTRPLPAGWRWTTLGDLADIKSGITLGKKRPASATLIAVPYLRVANVQRGALNLSVIKEIDVTESEAASLYLQPGDILLNEGGDRDKLGRGWVWSGEIPNCIHQNHVFRARLVEKIHSPKYISYYANEFGQDYFLEHGTQTTNLASISKAKLSSLPIPLAPPEEQNLIVGLLEDAFARTRRLEAEAARARALLDRLEAAILTKAFKGELVPQDPNDEPASVLLKRIRAQRAAVVSASKTKRGRRLSSVVG